MKTLAGSVLLAACLVALPALAFGALPLTVPDGWAAQKAEGALVMSPKDLASGKVYSVVIPDLTRKVGSVRGLLDTAKESLGAAGTFRPSAEPTAARTDQGWEVEVVIGTLEKDGKTVVAQALGLRKGDEEGVILVIADSFETMLTYSVAFAKMVRTMGAGADAPALAPSAPAGSNVDLKFRVPDGWTAKPVQGGVLLEQTVDTMYDKFSYRVLIFPSQPLGDTLRKTYLASWKAIVTPSLATTLVPLPLMRRLKSGGVVAFDTDMNAKVQSGAQVNAGLIILAQGTRYVPIYVVFFGGVMAGKLEQDLVSLLETAQIPNAGSGRVEMFAPADLVGEWSESSASYANYVTSSGAYAGDATIATGSGLTLNADQTFRSHFIAVTPQGNLKETDAGKWRLDDAQLVQSGKETKWWLVIGVGADAKGGAFLVLSTYSNQDLKPNYCNPRGAFQGTWYKRK